MLDMISRLGHRGLDNMQTLGNSGRFLIRVLTRKPDFLRLWPALCAQLYCCFSAIYWYGSRLTRV